MREKKRELTALYYPVSDSYESRKTPIINSLNNYFNNVGMCASATVMSLRKMKKYNLVTQVRVRVLTSDSFLPPSRSSWHSGVGKVGCPLLLLRPTLSYDSEQVCFECSLTSLVSSAKTTWCLMI